MTSYVTPKKNSGFIFYVGLVSQSTGQFQANPTIATGDFKVSIDGGTLNNLGTLPSVSPASSRLVKVTLSASEMNGDNIIFQGVDAAGSEWDEIIVNIQTTANQIDDLMLALSYTAPDNASITAIKAKTDNLPSDPADESILEGLIASIQSDTNDIQARLPAALSSNGNIKADLKSIDDELTSGNNATLNLKQLDIRNSGGASVYIESTGGANSSLVIYGGGTRKAIEIWADNATAIEAISQQEIGMYLEGNGEAGLSILGGAAAADGILVGSSTGKSINAPQDIAISDGNLTLANIAQSVLKYDWTSITGEASRSIINALRKLRNKISFNGTDTLTVYKEDGTTSAYTQSVTSDSDQEPFKVLGN